MPVLNCVCGHRIEGADDAALFDLMRVHSDQAHAELHITDAQIREVLALWSRMTPWDGRQHPLPGPLEIRLLGPERLDDFLRLFDREAFMDNPIWGSCYCMAPCVPSEQFRQQSGEQRRAGQRALIAGGQTQGLLAYAGGRVVGWCNATPRTALAGINAREEFRIDDDPARVGSIACFVIPAPYRRQGVATRLLEAAVERFRGQDFAIAEAYPPKDATSDAWAFRGTLKMYLAAGFTPYRERERSVIVRKSLSAPDLA